MTEIPESKRVIPELNFFAFFLNPIYAALA